MRNETKAVAIRYPKDSELPFITASAKGVLAERLLEIAKKEHVAVIKNDDLANVLSMQKVGACIPEETWQIMAKIFAFIMQVEDQNGKFYKS